MRRLGDTISRRVARPLGWYMPRGVNYLLRDEFIINRAAGSVNGTLAEPGPGTRTVVDTAGTGVAIASGVITLVGTVIWGQASLWYNAVSRVAGRLLLSQLSNSVGVEEYSCGFDVDQAGSAVAAIFAFRVDHNIDFMPGPADYAAYVPGTTYSLAIVLRAAGAYYFIKGGTWALWSFLWSTDSGVDATLYPNPANNRRAPAVTCDDVRIPDVIWLPTPLAYDTFTRANGPLGNSETTGPDGAAGEDVTARAWNNRVGTTLVAGNVASASALVGGIAIATVDTGTVDAIVKTTLSRVGGNVGVVLRYVDSNNYVVGYHDGTNCKLDKIVGGVTTNVITAVVVIGAGDVVVIPDGTAFSLFLNDVKIGATSTINDAALQTGTEQGVMSTNVGNTQDDFVVWPRGTGGEYSDLGGF